MFDFFPQAEPVWPLWMIAMAAILLIGLTLWTYRGVRAVRGRRRPLLLALRLAALATACVVVLRPTWAYRQSLRHPVSLVLLMDSSKSMTVRDEDPGVSRWEALRSDWYNAARLLAELESNQAVRIAIHTFDGKLGPEMLPSQMSWTEPPGGDRTGVMAALSQAYERPGKEHSPLLGIVLATDGQDNVGKPALDETIAKLARAPCPVHVIALGSPGASELQQDIIAQSIDAQQVARIKDKLTVRGVIQAQRFANQEIDVWLLIDGKPVKQADDSTKDVMIKIKPENASQVLPIEMPPCKLPDQPGEIKVSLRATPLPGELTETNNEVSTYVTLTKEGLSVLYIEGKLRAWEPRFLSRALKSDERITVYFARLYHDSGEAAEQERQALREDLERTPYDVFIIGDVPAARFGADLPSRIERAVGTRGAGLVMIGGHNSFGDGGWLGKAMETLLPIQLDAQGQLEGPAGGQREIKFVPTEAGLRHFVLRLDSDAERNRQWWDRLHTLDGGNRLGKRKFGATELAQTPQGELLLAVQDYGKGRTAALAVDTTWRWSRVGPPHDPREANNPRALSEGAEAHLRFWRQLILWLARQEEAGKSLRIELDHRRLAAGKEQGIRVQARELTPGGSKDQQKPLKNVEFTVKVINPKKVEAPVTVTPEETEGKARGFFYQTDEPGEYEAIVTARHQGTDLGMARARFMAYRDDSEMLNRIANHSLLEQIARSTGGSFRVHGGLKDLLEELQPQAAAETTRLIKFPNWQQPNWPLQTALFLIFVGLISVEWLLRRLWGLV